MMTSTEITVTLTKTRKRTKRAGTIDGTGWTLYGNVGGNGPRKWLERWFPTGAAAHAYAAKRGYTVKPLEPFAHEATSEPVEVAPTATWVVVFSDHDEGCTGGHFIRRSEDDAKRSAELMSQCGYRETSHRQWTK